MAKSKGLSIEKVGNLLLLSKKGIGTVFQTHSKDEMYDYLCKEQRLLTEDLVIREVSPMAIKYSRTTKRP